MHRIIQAVAEPAISQVRELFREYGSLPGVTPCIQDFEIETASLPGPYGPPAGALFLALSERPGSDDESIGCAGLRRLEDGICEMKRLYVRPSHRGTGAGRSLVQALIAQARGMGYLAMRLDTLPAMREAQELYRRLGFVEILPYLTSPTPNALCFELALIQT